MVRARSPRFFFFFFFIFFCFSLFSLLSHLPGAFLFAFVLIFVFFLFVFLLFFLFFLFAFFLFIFILIFYSCFFFVLSFCFFFLFTFALIFVFCFLFLFLFFFLVFIFASLFFFVILFVLLFYPPHSNLFPHYPTARRPFVFSPPPPIFPIPSSHFPAAAKKKKNIGKRIHWGRMVSQERTGGGRKDRGTEWSPERDGKKIEKDMYTTREEIREKKKWAPQGEVWFPGWNFAERRQALPPKAAGRERKGGRKGEKCVYSICLLFHLFLCIFTNTKMDDSFVHIFMYI